MTLYEIDRAIQEALNSLVDEETGEVSEEGLQALEQLQVGLDQKLDNIGCLCKNLQAEAEALKAEEAVLKKRRESKEKKVDRLKEYMLSVMQNQGMVKHESVRVVASLRRSVAVCVEQESDIPAQYIKEKVERSIDKVGIKQALKAGEIVPGAHLEERESLQLK